MANVFVEPADMGVQKWRCHCYVRHDQHPQKVLSRSTQRGVPISRFGILLTVLLSLSCSVKATGAGVDDCSKFKEFGLPQNAYRLFFERAFLVVHSSKTKTPVWTIERMGRRRSPISKGVELGSFTEDPDIPAGIRSLSAVYEGIGNDRGRRGTAIANSVKDVQYSLRLSVARGNIPPNRGESNCLVTIHRLRYQLANRDNYLDRLARTFPFLGDG